MANWVADFLERNPAMAVLPVVKRGRYGLHLRDGNQRMAFVTGQPMHYFDQNQREWRAIDTTLKELGNGEYGILGSSLRIAKDGAVSLREAAYSHQVTRVGVLAKSVFGGLEELPAGKVQGDRLVRESGPYRLESILTESGLREELHILEKPPNLAGAADDLLVLEASMPSGSFPNGWLEDHSRKGYRFPVGQAWDADFNQVAVKRWVAQTGNAQQVYSGVPLGWLDQARYPVVIDPDFSGDSGDGQIEGGNTNYALARTTPSSHSTSGIVVNTGQSASGGVFLVYRGFFKFNTATIGGSATILQVNLQLTFSLVVSDPAFNVDVVRCDWSGQDPLTSANRTAAYNSVISSVKDATIANTGSATTNTPYLSPGLDTDYVDPNGATYYATRSSRDYSSVPPNYSERVLIHTREASTVAYRPLLIVVYDPGPTARFVVPAPGIGLYDTRIKLRACARRTALKTKVRND
ncbi:MAG: hypothetical protein JXB38_20420 [Anaerolineales bacterium]|nr:hypothetical protein [Anaerolineales bacterium]